MKRIWFALALASIAYATPVQDIGALTVSGSKIIGSVSQQPAQLRGMSMFWSQADVAQGYYNASVVNWLADDWHVNVIRAALGVSGDWGTGQSSYLSDSADNAARVKAVVDGCIAKGIYVLVDWHDGDPTSNTTKAVAYFTTMAKTYANVPNVIFEILNEPTGDNSTWPAIKTYATAVINAIRGAGANNLIVVGTPKYSSEVAYAAQNPLTGTNMTNIAYTFHYYASEPWHYNTVANGGGDYRGKADSAMNLYGKALFVTEWGLTPASGDGTINMAWVNEFMTWLTTNKMSWCNWSISDKSETSAALIAGSQSGSTWIHNASTSGGWATSQLTPSGLYIRGETTTLNPAWSSGALASSSSSKASSSASAVLFTQSNGVPVQWHALTNGVTIDAGAKTEFTNAQLFTLMGRQLAQSELENGRAQLQASSSLHGTYIVRLSGGNSDREQTFKLTLP